MSKHWDLPTTPGDKVAIDTLSACCTQLWYRHYAKGTLPAKGELRCPCGSQVVKRPDGWWHGKGKTPRREGPRRWECNERRVL